VAAENHTGHIEASAEVNPTGKRAGETCANAAAIAGAG